MRCVWSARLRCCQDFPAPAPCRSIAMQCPGCWRPRKSTMQVAPVYGIPLCRPGQESFGSGMHAPRQASRFQSFAAADSVHGVSSQVRVMPRLRRAATLDLCALPRAPSGWRFPLGLFGGCNCKDSHANPCLSALDLAKDAASTGLHCSGAVLGTAF